VPFENGTRYLGFACGMLGGRDGRYGGLVEAGESQRSGMKAWGSG
jgi:hypothetical protein